MGAEVGSTLATSLLADQRKRWERDDRVPVEDLVQSHAALANNPEAVVDVSYAQVLLRREFAYEPPPDEYVSRFPNLAEPIRTQFELDAAIDFDSTQFARGVSSPGPADSSPPKQ